MTEDEEQVVDAFSHYASVSEKVHDDVHEAVDAYSYLNSKWSQNMGITPQSKSSCKRAILRICKRLAYEIEMSREGDEEIKDIHDRWTDDEEEPGYLALLENASLEEEPPWLSQMVDDLTRASWRLGYLRAGRMQTVQQTDEARDEAAVKEMFD